MREFGDLESAIMDVMWAADRPFAVRDVRERMSYPRPVAYTTVMTVMDNLRKKGWLRRTDHGRAYRYEPTVSGDEYSAGVMRQGLAASSDPAAALMRFVGDLSAEEANALEEAYLRLARGDGASPGDAR